MSALAESWKPSCVEAAHRAAGAGAGAGEAYRASVQLALLCAVSLFAVTANAVCLYVWRTHSQPRFPAVVFLLRFLLVLDTVFVASVVTSSAVTWADSAAPDWPMAYVGCPAFALSSYALLLTLVVLLRSLRVASCGVTSREVTSGGVTSGKVTSGKVTSGGVTSGEVTSGGVVSPGVTTVMFLSAAGGVFSLVFVSLRLICRRLCADTESCDLLDLGLAVLGVVLPQLAGLVCTLWLAVVLRSRRQRSGKREEGQTRPVTVQARAETGQRAAVTQTLTKNEESQRQIETAANQTGTEVEQRVTLKAQHEQLFLPASQQAGTEAEQTLTMKEPQIQPGGHHTEPLASPSGLKEDLNLPEKQSSNPLPFTLTSSAKSGLLPSGVDSDPQESPGTSTSSDKPVCGGDDVREISHARCSNPTPLGEMVDIPRLRTVPVCVEGHVNAPRDSVPCQRKPAVARDVVPRGAEDRVQNPADPEETVSVVMTVVALELCLWVTSPFLLLLLYFSDHHPGWLGAKDGWKLQTLALMTCLLNAGIKWVVFRLFCASFNRLHASLCSQRGRGQRSGRCLLLT